MTETFANLASSTLALDIDDVDTELIVADDGGTGPFAFPLEGNFRIIVEDEFMMVSSRIDEVFTIERGVEDTVAALHVAGVEVTQVLTVEGFQTGVGELIEVVIANGAGSPEGVVTADPTTLYQDTTHNELYFKAGGSGNTGWVLMTHTDSSAHVGYALLTADDHPQYVLKTLASAKGDIVVRTSSTTARLAVGTTNAQLTADSAQAGGVKWL